MEGFISKPKVVEPICTRHGVSGCYFCLKQAVKEVLLHTYVAGNGGFISDFGLITFNELVKLTDFDVNKREGKKIKKDESEDI